ncbi:hypothetical protein ACF07V_11280 [Streptomyces sp. NPDC015661]|uniref:hypothetical protein n=1 Tax=Streptomyces sp. NPDC015661 TaxID=3364961 RepID=UPI0036FBB3ED
MTSSEEGSRRIEVNIDALGESRVYQVAEGSMYIGDVDSTVVTARKLAAMPVQQAAEKLVQMPTDERAAVLAEMTVPAAAVRISRLPPPMAVEILLGMDEQLAIERLLAMNSLDAQSVALVTPEPFRSDFLAKMTLDQVVRLIGEVDEATGMGSFNIETLKSFAVCLPVPVLSALLTRFPPVGGAQILEAAVDRDIVVWLAMGDPSARLALVAHMPVEWAEKAIIGLADASDQLRQVCDLYGVEVPRIGEVLGALGEPRIAELVATSDIGPAVYSGLSPEMRVNLIGPMNVQGLADVFPRLEGRLADCVSSMMAADQSRPFRAPLACRYIAAAVAVSGIDAHDLMGRLPRPQAAALWDSHWAYGVARQLETLETGEACQKFASVASESHKVEIAWHLSYEARDAMERHLDSFRLRSSKRDHDRKILRQADRGRHAPDPLR